MCLRFTIIRGGRRTAPAVQARSLTLDTTVGSVAGPVLAAGSTHTVTVTGTVSDWNGALTKGTPEPNATYPTTGGLARKSTQVGCDAETIFAQPSNFSHTLGHWTQLQINTGSGFKHVEPVGGPYTKPAAGHSYTYRLTGEGQPLTIRWADSPLNDNYGAFRIEVN